MTCPDYRRVTRQQHIAEQAQIMDDQMLDNVRNETRPWLVAQPVDDANDVIIEANVR